MTVKSLTTGSTTRNPTTWLGRTFAAAYLLILVTVCGYLVMNGPQIHAAREAEKARVIGEEDLAFCAKLGVGSGTSHFTECAAGLKDIRASHDRRNADSIL